MSEDELIKWEDSVDLEFIQRVQAEVTQSCALPFAVPVERIPSFIIQAAQWFWLNYDKACEERMYIIPNKEICRGNAFNKIVQLPHQIEAVIGVYKAQDDLRYGTLGDFSLERMMMSSYSLFGGAGSIGGGFGGTAGFTGYSLTDVVTALYEVDTFRQTLTAPLTYDFNPFSHVSWNLLKFMSTESVMPSNHLILCHPLLLLSSVFPSFSVFSNESAHSYQVAKVLELQHQSFQ